MLLKQLVEMTEVTDADTLGHVNDFIIGIAKKLKRCMNPHFVAIFGKWSSDNLFEFSAEAGLTHSAHLANLFQMDLLGVMRIALKRICQRTIVANNTIYNCGNGITLEHASTSSDYSRNTSILGNRLRYIGYMGSSSGVGINLRVSDYSIVADNRMEDIKGRGVMIDGSQYCSVSGNVIEMKETADAAYNNGIELKPRVKVGCNFNTIRGNVIVAPRQNGLYFASASVPCEHNSVSGNIVKAAGGMGVRLDAGSSFNVFSDNIMEGGGYDLGCNAGALQNSFSNNDSSMGKISGTPDQSSGTAYSLINNKRQSVGSSAPSAGTWQGKLYSLPHLQQVAQLDGYALRAGRREPGSLLARFKRSFVSPIAIHWPTNSA